jgi:hypothetical protein
METTNTLTTPDWGKALAETYEADLARTPVMGIRWMKMVRGVFDLDGITATELRVVLLDWMYAYSLYAGPYDPSNTAPPVCWAVGAIPTEMSNSDMVPSPKSTSVQSRTCATCWASQYKTSGMYAPGDRPNGRGGKACNNSVRLALLALRPQGETTQFNLKIPPSSIALFHTLVNHVQRDAKIPMRAVSFRVSFEASVPYSRVVFDQVTQVHDADLIADIAGYPPGKNSAIRASLSRGFEGKRDPEDDDTP